MVATRAQAPWPEQEELLTSYSAQVGMSGRGGTPGGTGPARRQGQHSSQALLPEPSAWGQPEPAASRGSGTGMPSAGGAARMPRVSHPLRVEPPAEYNSPRRTAIGKPAGRPKSSQLKDYAVLASACRRAGKPANAAQLMFNRGVLHDNAGEAGQALRCYKDLLRTSLETGDVVSEALACNCIGVTLQMQGVHKVEEALKYHLQHLAAADVPGKFIAHSNIGLAYQARTARLD